MMKRMEHKLKMLFEASSDTNRTEWALESKRQGKRVIGVICGCVPEEVIFAAGMLPWRIAGTWQGNVSRALAYRSEGTCWYCTHVIESLLADELDFLDGVVVASVDQDSVRFADVCRALNKVPFVYTIYVPHLDSKLGREQFAREIQKFVKALEEFGGVRVSLESLNAARNLYRKMQGLLWKLYQLRKQKVPALSGAEVLRITTAASVMPKDTFVQELEPLLPYLEERRTSLRQIAPRLLVSSDMLDNAAWIELVEDCGCLVAMDDLDTGSRYFWPIDDEHALPTEPMLALATETILRCGYSTVGSWERQVDRVVGWAREFMIDGVLDLPQINCFPRAFRIPFFSRRMAEEGIPYMKVERDYPITNIGQMKTRIGAFIEQLE